MKDSGMGVDRAWDRLVEQARRGELRAYNELVLRHQARAYNLAYRLVGNAEDAADATQESFIKGYRKIGQFQGGSFEAWLLRIVVNTCYDALRSRQRRSALSAEFDEGEVEPDQDARWRDRGETPEEHALRAELMAGIRAAIGTLPADHRTVLVLSDVEGMSYEEIAAVLAVPMGTVKSRLARARARVRDILEARGMHAGGRRPAPGPERGPQSRERVAATVRPDPTLHLAM